ncbi:MAG: hypothetical protein G01um10147_942 [Microgenomates group bacterium Gr01-1014_7]|nr:MAG: hypothetical protein G01um10147_942 [Microgenomates group bacterium Gr01-1014_7]
MRIAILGAGFTGLSAAYQLLKKGHDVTIFEKENSLGGLAVGFSDPNWDWTLERAYHHWFTNDDAILKLAGEINHKVIIKRPSTDIFIKGKTLPFDNALSLLSFPHLPIVDRIRMGMVIFYLKQINNYKKLEGKKAANWIRKWMGEKAFSLIWDPLLSGKFGEYKNQIALTWFWARIKKRTPKLAYPEGGFQMFADHLGAEIKKLGGKILLNTEVKNIEDLKKEYDKIIVTLPSPVFAKIANLPQGYKKRITSIPHLHAQVLILILKKPFMNKTYWLNITDKNFPFLVLAEHTNFMNPKNYGGQHILYIGNYLPQNHPYLKMDADELLKKFDPFLRKINPTYHSSLITHHLFVGPFAQPVVTVDYPKKIPAFKTPLKSIYLANLDMVYPWDRGTNYAVELGRQVASIVSDE